MHMRPRDFELPTRRRFARDVRTILAIDDDVLEAARCIADDEGVSVGDVMSRLARRGLEPRTQSRGWERFQPFAVSREAPLIATDIERHPLDD